MSNEQTQNQNDTETEETKQIVKEPPKPKLTMTSTGFVPTTMDEAWRFATALSRTNMVPQHYRDKPDECLIALDLAARLETNWLAVMQHTYDVHGRLGFEAKFVTALINRSGLYTDPLEYEVKGENADDDDYAVRAYATSRRTGKVLYGPWIGWKLVNAEGWSKKKDSKWLTMPEQMFHYRAASWFKNRHCPEVTIGIPTAEELEDTPERKPVESMTYEETEQQAQEKIETEQGSEPVDAEFEQPQEELTPAQKAAKTRAANKAKREAAKKAEAKPETLYVCKKCGHKFDEPRLTGPDDEKVKVCPNTSCLSFDISATADETPEFMKDKVVA
jgi:rubrerythrin